MIFDDEKAAASLQRKVLQVILILLWLALGFVIIKIGGYFSEILNALAIATLINYLLAGPVSFLTKYIKFRAVSVLIIYFSFLSTIVFIIYSLLPTITSQLGALKKTIPMLISEIDNLIFNFNIFLQTNYQLELPVKNLELTDILNNLLHFAIKLNLSDVSSTATTLVSGSVYIGLYVVLTLVLSFYLLVDGKRAWGLFLIPFSDRLTKHLIAVKSKIDKSLHAFIAGQFQIASLTSTVMLITYLCLGSPYSVLFALIQMLEIIPLIGTWAAIVPCIIMVFVTSGSNQALIAFTVYIIYTQFVRDNFVAPRIMGDALGFHPLSIITAVIVGAKVGGAMGVIFALPVLAIITSVIDYNLELSRLKTTRYET